MCGFLASTVSCGESKSCDASSCAAGCCNADGECVTNTTAAQCGSNGRQCSACGFAQVCQLGQCYGGTNGGGSGSTGGGSGSTGGGTGSNPTCTQLGAAETAFYAGNTECTATFDGGTVTVSASSSAVAGCNAALSNAACSTTDRTKVTTYVSCLQAAPHCTAGNENTALTSFQACAEALLGPSGLSTACAAVVTNPPPTGGGTGVTGGGAGSTGGGSGVTGGGSATTGGGSGVTGGGSGVTGGGSGVTGGGSGVTGGGSGVTGGGSGVTGGGSGVTGGGSGVTGGGSGSACATVAAAQDTFFAGNSSCGGLPPISNLQAKCQASCTTNDQSVLVNFGSCIGEVQCTSGNESAAQGLFASCYESYVNSLTTTCQNALTGSGTGGGTGTTGGGTGTTGGGTGATGGGTGTTGGGTGTTGGGTAACTAISLGSFATGTSSGNGLTIYTADPIGTAIGTSDDDFAQLRFTSASTGTFAFSTTGLNIATCSRCLLVGQDAPSGGAPVKVYAATSGNISVSGSSPVTGPLSASLSTVKLVEGTIDSTTGAFTVTSGGACLTVASATVTASGPPPTPTGWTCDASWYQDGSCDCGCGVKDADCASTTNESECQYCLDCNANGNSATACQPYVNSSNTTQCL